MNDNTLAKGLGWFSIGLGLTELFAPRQVAQMIGVDDGHENLLRGLGLREIASGAGVLSSSRPTGWIWSRVAGDAMDLALLGAAFSSGQHDRKKLTGAVLAVAAVTAADVVCGLSLNKHDSENGQNGYRADNGRRQIKSGAVSSTAGEPVRKVITIGRSPEEIYAFWRNFEHLPQFMNHLKSVQVLDEGRSHWIAKGPMDTSVEWDAEIVDDTPNQLISWRSLPGADVETTGSVTFAPATGGRGTVVRVELQYKPPLGVIGKTIAMLFGEAPEKQIAVDLHRIKQLLETGEITRTEGQSAGRPQSTSRRYDDFVRV